MNLVGSIAGWQKVSRDVTIAQSRGRGGIGRRARFRSVWITSVEVRPLSSPLMRLGERMFEGHPEGLTELQERLCAALFEIGAVKIDKETGFHLKLHETNPEAPLSPIYVDLRALPGSPEVKAMALDVYEEIARQMGFHVIAGIPVAATALASSLSDRLGVGLRTPRMEKKTHGTGAPIDGVMPGDQGKIALLLDDLVTGAHSKIEAAKILRQGGYIVRDVMVLINRGGEKAIQELQAHGLMLHAAFTLEQMLEYLVRVGKISVEDRQTVLDYLGRN